MAPRTSARGWLLALTWLAAFTSQLDSGIVNLALPRVAEAFAVDLSSAAWLVTAYILPFAVSILAAGRLADRLGQRRVIAAGVLLFGLGSLIAGLAPTFVILLAGRAVQGVGAAGLLTVALAMVSSTYAPEERPRALGLFFSGGALGGVVGPIVGGVLADLAGWRAIFVTQLPLALLLLVLIIMLVSERRGPARSLDVPGLVLATVGLFGINVALLQGDEWGWTSPPILVAWALTLVALPAFVARERRAAEPAVRLSVFRSRAFVAASLAGAAAWFSIISVTILLALYLQGGRGLSATEAGLVIAPYPLAAFLAFPHAGRVARAFGIERVMVAGLILLAISGAAMIAFDAATPLPLVSAVGILGGVSTALVIVTSAAEAIAEFAPAEAGVASGIFNSLRQIGAAVGVAIPAAVFDIATGGVMSGPTAVSGGAAAFAVRALLLALVALLVAGLSLPQPAAQAVSPDSSR
jgi:EmrB/QacA subfamily drug resistance transporter